MGMLQENTKGVQFGSEQEARSYDFRKFIFLSLGFFCVVGAYTIVRELKDSVFLFIVGRSYIPLAKGITMFALVPAVFLYSYLVDRMRRYWLLVFYCMLYAVLGLVFAYLLGHPTIGLPNTHQSPYRLFGWIFYFFIEGFSPFVVSLFWAFANSVSSPESAKKSYAFMTSGSKLGGMLTAGIAWFFLSVSDVPGQIARDCVNHQALLILTSLVLCFVPIVLYFMMRSIPGKFLHGYEAVYKVEKKRSKERVTMGIFSGLKMLFKYPYVMGIFGMLYFYEVVNAVLNYLKLGEAESIAGSFSIKTCYLFKIAFFQHLVGFFISFIATSSLMRRFGERVCLILIPVVSGLVLFYLMFSKFMGVTTGSALVVAVVVFKAINYAFSSPVRESLYIPTVKEIKFKSKSWIDAFGGKFAKLSGQGFNVLATNIALVGPMYGAFFAAIIGLWTMTAYSLGKRFEIAIAKNEAIGSEEELQAIKERAALDKNNAA